MNKPDEQSFPALIQHELNAAVLSYMAVNAGSSGDTSASGLSRLSYWLSQPVDVFMLALGANDLLRGLSPVGTQVNLQRIIDLAKAKHPGLQMLLLGMQLPLCVPGQRAAEFRQLYQNLATKNNMALLPFLLDGVAGIAHLNMYDGVHPLAEGYKIIAKKVWPVLKLLLESKPVK